MNAPARTGIIVLVLLVAVAFLASTFVVDQRQQALVLRFGAVRTVAREPGLYLKVPLIENVVYIDKRVLDLDLPAQEVIAADQKRLVVDSFARYRVIDPLRFYQTVNSIAGANNRLASIVNSTVRQVLADGTFAAIVRTDREAMMKRIAGDVNGQARGLGVEVVDVRLRRVDLPEQNSQAVFQRMQTERQREATDIRAQGTQIAQGIRAKADRDVTVIVAEANKTAEQLRGAGDAAKNRILGEVFGKDPDFSAFYRSMQAYETSLKPNDTRMLLSPDWDFFRYLTNPSGERAGQRDAGPAATTGGTAATGGTAPTGGGTAATTGATAPARP